MIESLTPEQEALLPVYRDKWIKIGLSTKPAVRDDAEKYLNEMYKVANLPEPKEIKWAKSPLEAVNMVGTDPADEVKNFIYGNHEAGWLSFYEFFLEVCELECCEVLRPIMNFSKVAGWCLPYEELAIICERPINISLDDRGFPDNRPHGTSALRAVARLRFL